MKYSTHYPEAQFNTPLALITNKLNLLTEFISSPTDPSPTPSAPEKPPLRTQAGKVLVADRKALQLAQLPFQHFLRLQGFA